VERTVDPASGAYENHLQISADCNVAVSPDRRTLFVTSNSLSAYDVSADTFQLKQEGSGGDYGFYPDDIEINNAGPFLALPGATGNSNTNYTTSEVSTSDINVFHGSYHTGAYCGSLAFSADDTVLFEDIITGNKVDLFNIATSQLLSSIHVRGDANDVLLDYSGTELFVSHTSTFGSPGVEIFATGLPARRPIPAPRSLANVSTRMEVGIGDNLGIGGFIVKGTKPKKLSSVLWLPAFRISGCLDLWLT
jgi:hypothetical protein